jgi:hypothetical protein
MNIILSVERNGKKKGESPGRVDLGKRKTKRHAATKAAKKVGTVPRSAYFNQHYSRVADLDPDPHGSA